MFEDDSNDSPFPNLGYVILPWKVISSYNALPFAGMPWPVESFRQVVLRKQPARRNVFQGQNFLNVGH